MKIQSDLKDVPLAEGQVVFRDRSSKKNTFGKTEMAYAVVTVHCPDSLPPSFSAQSADLLALTQTCKLMKDKQVTIYTDSQYPNATSYVFAVYWEHRSLMTSTGKAVTNAQLLKPLIAAIQLPKLFAICKFAAQTGT